MFDYSSLVTFSITILNIVILYFILKKILFKPMTKFMADRAGRIQGAIDQASREKAAAQEMLEEYRGKLENADAEAQGILSAARVDAAAAADRIIAEGKAEADAMILGARKRMEVEHQAAIAQFGLEAAALVMAASARLVQREFTSEDSRRCAAMLLEELAAQKGKL
jgi:F-type H+-transporting ATPase subunit b